MVCQHDSMEWLLGSASNDDTHRFPETKHSMSLSRRNSPGLVDILTRFRDWPMEWQSIEDVRFIVDAGTKASLDIMNFVVDGNERGILLRSPISESANGCPAVELRRKCGIWKTGRFVNNVCPSLSRQTFPELRRF